MASPEVKRKKSCDDDGDDYSYIPPLSASSDSEQASTATATIVTMIADPISLASSKIIDDAETLSIIRTAHGSNGEKKTDSFANDESSEERRDESMTDNDVTDELNAQKPRRQEDASIEEQAMSEKTDDRNFSTYQEQGRGQDDRLSASDTLERTHAYRFNGEGQLRHVTTGDVFKFDVFGERAKNQKRYEEIGELLDLVIYDLLETSVNLRRVVIPLDAAEDEPKGFVFSSADFDTNPRLLVLIHGSGVVRAGQWARRLIINDCLDSGTQLPFIREAQSMGFAVLVLNTNQNSIQLGGKEQSDTKLTSSPIRGSENPRAHGTYVWEKLVMDKQHFTDIVVVAHSFGGIVTTEIASEFSTHWYSRVRALALTDSVHGERAFTLDRRLATWFSKYAVNWVTSGKEVDTPLRRSSTVPCVSAGHTSHENTSWSAFKSIFTFFRRKLETASG